jgi:hypothetical protein
VLAVYRLPIWNFKKFLQKLNNIFSIFHNNKAEFIICGDVNINYLENCDRRQQLDALLSTYNLIGMVISLHELSRRRELQLIIYRSIRQEIILAAL